MILAYNPLVSGIHIGEFVCFSGIFFTMFQGLGALRGVLGGFQESLPITVAIGGGMHVLVCLYLCCFLFFVFVFVYLCVFVFLAVLTV